MEYLLGSPKEFKGDIDNLDYVLKVTKFLKDEECPNT